MSTLIVNITDLYTQHFGTKPTILGEFKNQPAEGSIARDPKVEKSKETIIGNNGSIIKETYLDTEIWLPIRLKFIDGTMFYLPYATIRISGSKTFIKTPLAERKGSVKELFNTDDYKITIKGFFIDKTNRSLPVEDLAKLEKLFNSNTRCYLENAISNLFLKNEDAVVITSFELPEVEGGKLSLRPFVMQLESDSVFELIVQ